jgi:putative ABC transport system permease protein
VRGLWLRWVWRDFRSRWVQILTTALIVAVGIGAVAGLGGLEQWRERSADESMATARAHALRIDLAPGASAPAGTLRDAVRTLPAGAVAAAEERLVVPSQVDASRPGKPVLVPARLIGIPLAAGGQPVDALSVKDGDGLRAGGALLDWNFAQHYDLPPSGELRVAGLGPLRYSGTGVSPQYFLILDEAGGFSAESGLAVVYVPLATAQRAAARPGAVNQLLIRAAAGQDPEKLRALTEAALEEALPAGGWTITTAGEEPVARILYRDARNDQKTYNAFAVILLAGAMLAAFNLVSRVVEAQRREIGIGMALGASPRVLAVRPLVLGLQIGVLGVVFGIPVGIGLGELIRKLLRDFLPLPVYASTFPLDLFVLAAALGMVIPLAAAALPVRRAISVAPVDAIRTGHRAARGAGATAAMRRLRFGGGAIAQLPLRNLARTPRRTLITILGLAATLTAVVAVLSMVDSIRDIADRQRADIARTSPGRLEITLTAPTRSDGPAIRRLADMPGVDAIEPGLTVPAAVVHGGESLDVALSLADPDSDIWRPQAADGSAEGDGILLAGKAAEDLGVSVGDTVVLHHPRRTATGLGSADTRVTVAGIHESPVRRFAYMDAAQAGRLGLAGLANTVALVPRQGVPADSLERALFGRPGIASIRPAVAEAEALKAAVDDFNSAIEVVAFITLALAILVAFTSTSVAVEERRREYATMFAFGLPPRTGLRVAATESLLTGVAGTVAGLAAGLAVATWIVHSLLPDTFPDLSARLALSPASVITTLAVGIIAVTLAPLLTYRRMTRMDIPSTLRVME